jgi:hypothetical protein
MAASRRQLMMWWRPWRWPGARGAEAVDGGAGHARRAAGAEGSHPRDVVALRAVGLAAAQDHVLDFAFVELRDLAERVLDAVSGEVVRPGHVE